MNMKALLKGEIKFKDFFQNIARINFQENLQNIRILNQQNDKNILPDLNKLMFV